MINKEYAMLYRDQLEKQKSIFNDIIHQFTPEEFENNIDYYRKVYRYKSYEQFIESQSQEISKLNKVDTDFVYQLIKYVEKQKMRFLECLSRVNPLSIIGIFIFDGEIIQFNSYKF